MTTTRATTQPTIVRTTAAKVIGSESTEPSGETRLLEPGTSVEVRSRFDRRWTRGFSVDAVVGDAYRLRRASDGAVLPAHFHAEDVRPAAQPG